ncbi:hypothetical protein KFE96_04950 [Kordiimonas sp. SCSIO 12603]|uniref:SMODS domain-containing nucleotidyltransferase n=1 Tax=Kordiimonas sp. SCSIO 12603 TaxID=2829596 RepID=UPI00210448FC|nr:hypothetical protein [Kordiimonas sp. SCSIO 12603]UTW59654.1 hypothetical protein KFE96_04950 [Kordiimonas sp. SCSIO 12603]
MKQTKLFDQFYNQHVKLDRKRTIRLKQHITSVESFLKKTKWSHRIVSIQMQGSWRHGTMIQPLPKKEYDADMLVLLQPNSRWKASDYLDQIYSAFKKSPTYSSKVSRKTRCVTLDYAGDFHLDVVPCIIRQESELIFFRKETYFVCNRNLGRYERTDGDGFAMWLEKKKAVVPGANLRKVIQLLKYMRDHKQTFAVKSILMTTLIGNCIRNNERERDFTDIPTSLQTILTRVDNYLSHNETTPLIKNPAYEKENFNRNWEEVNYQNFKRQIRSLKLRVDDAISEPGRNSSLQKWQALFGQNFGSK